MTLTTDTAPTTSHGTARDDDGPSTTFETLAVCGFIFGIFAIVAAVFAVGLAARAAGDARGQGGGATPASSVAASGAGTLDVSLKEFSIDPGAITVKSGAVLRIANDGAIVHNLSVDGVASGMLDPGASGELDLGSLAPGTYTMRCDVPGHEAAGMKGTVTVG